MNLPVHLKRSFILLICAALWLASCAAPASAPTAQAQVAAPPSATPLPPPVSLAAGRPATASSSTTNELPAGALDGTPLTRWNAGAPAPQWIQIDLQNIATLRAVRLTVSQPQAGETVHQVLAGANPLQMSLVHEFKGQTTDGQVLEFTVDPPLSGVRYIQIVTTQSPSPAAWKEIEVLGYPGEAIPTPTPQKEVADLIYVNAQVLTMEKDQPTAEAIAIKGDRILAVGTRDEVLAYQGLPTRVVDLGGLTVTPGFIDSHGHRIGDRNLYGQGTTVQQVFDRTLSEGWTSIHELYVNEQRLNELTDLARKGQLPVRVSAYLAVAAGNQYGPWYFNIPYKPLQQIGYLQIAGIKITLDQEWGEKVFFDQQQLNTMVTDATSRGWQVATHSFSPQANAEVLNAYELALNGASNDKLRLRLEHTGVMTDAEVQQMARLGIIGSVQFINASMWSEDPSFKKFIPAAEVQHTARWRDMLNAGIFLIGNTDDPWCCTDWRHNFKRPTDPAGVMQSLYQGVTRTNFLGRLPEPWQVAQAVTVDEALHMMTINGAYASHLEDQVGSLKPGKYADLVILSDNPLNIPIDQIPSLNVLVTMVGGHAAYCAEGRSDLCVSSNP